MASRFTGRKATGEFSPARLIVSKSCPILCRQFGQLLYDQEVRLEKISPISLLPGAALIRQTMTKARAWTIAGAQRIAL
jgi:hypothetical protein